MERLPDSVKDAKEFEEKWNRSTGTGKMITPEKAIEDALEILKKINQRV